MRRDTTGYNGATARTIPLPGELIGLVRRGSSHPRPGTLSGLRFGLIDRSLIDRPTLVHHYQRVFVRESQVGPTGASPPISTLRVAHGL